MVLKKNITLNLVKYKLGIVALLLTANSCNVNFILPEKDLKAIPEPTALYLKYGCCDETKTNYECHVLSVLKLYKELFSNIENKAISKHEESIDARMRLFFNNENKLDSISILDATEGAVLVTKEMFLLSIAKNEVFCIRSNIDQNRNYITIEFKYFSNSLYCLEIPQVKLLEDCSLENSNFDAKIKYKDKEFKWNELANLPVQDLEVSVKLNDYMWNCFEEYQRPEIFIHPVFIAKRMYR